MCSKYYQKYEKLKNIYDNNNEKTSNKRNF